MNEDQEYFALLLFYGDRSGIQCSWGPFSDMRAVEAAQAELESYGLGGLWGTLPLKRFPGTIGVL